MPTMRGYCFALIALMLLAGCGWHARGAQEIQPQLQKLQLLTAPADLQFAKRLRRSLTFAGVELDAQGSSYALKIDPILEQQRNVSLDRQARSAEQELRIMLTFELHDPAGAVVFGPRKATASRIYSYDPNNIIAKADEEKLIRGELHENLIGQIFRQVQRIDPALLK
jgi:LPS-assembly lipoprotein